MSLLPYEGLLHTSLRLRKLYLTPPVPSHGASIEEVLLDYVLINRLSKINDVKTYVVSQVHFKYEKDPTGIGSLSDSCRLADPGPLRTDCVVIRLSGRNESLT